jgi:hypothetical protein
VLIRTVTWNLCAKPPPSNSDICVNLLPRDRFVTFSSPVPRNRCLLLL